MCTPVDSAGTLWCCRSEPLLGAQVYRSAQFLFLAEHSCLTLRIQVGSWLVVAIPLLYLGFTLFMIEKDGSMVPGLLKPQTICICTAKGQRPSFEGTHVESDAPLDHLLHRGPLGRSLLVLAMLCFDSRVLVC